MHRWGLQPCWCPDSIRQPFFKPMGHIKNSHKNHSLRHYFLVQVGSLFNGSGTNRLQWQTQVFGTCFEQEPWNASFCRQENRLVLSWLDVFFSVLKVVEQKFLTFMHFFNWLFLEKIYTNRQKNEVPKEDKAVNFLVIQPSNAERW